MRVATAADGAKLCPGGLRIATYRDDAALRSLAREVPMSGGGIRYALEREPDFFALTRLQSDEAEVAVVDAPSEERSRIVAMATRAPIERLFRGRIERFDVLGDLKVHPAHRGRGHGLALFELAARRLREDRSRAGIAVVLEGNSAMTALARSAGRELRIEQLATIEHHAILFAPRCELARGERIRPAEPSDQPAMAALWDRVCAARELAPPWTGRGAPGVRAQTPGLGVDRFTLLERDGELVAFAARWDSSAVRQVRVRSVSRALACVRTAQRAIAAVTGRPPLARDGEILRRSHLACSCAATARDLRALVAHLARDAASSGDAYVDLALDARDPLRAALRGSLRATVRYALIGLTPRAAAPIGALQRPAWIEMSLA